MQLTRIDLNSWIFHIGGQTVLVDPWLIDPLVFYGQPWLFTADHTTPPIYTPTTLPPIDLILLSQGLDDHAHKPTLEQLDRQIPVVGSPTAAKVAQGLGFAKVTAIANWQTYELGDLQITAVPGAEIQPGQVENGYLVHSLHTTLYYEPHQSPLATLTKAQIGSIDVAIAPVVGQAIPGLGQVIMGPLQAMELIAALNPRYFVPTALGEIRASGILPLLIRTIGSVEEFRDRLIASGLPTELRLPQPGETLSFAAS